MKLELPKTLDGVERLINRLIKVEDHANKSWDGNSVQFSRDEIHRPPSWEELTRSENPVVARIASAMVQMSSLRNT